MVFGLPSFCCLFHARMGLLVQRSADLALYQWTLHSWLFNSETAWSQKTGKLNSQAKQTYFQISRHPLRLEHHIQPTLLQRCCARCLKLHEQTLDNLIKYKFKCETVQTHQPQRRCPQIFPPKCQITPDQKCAVIQTGATHRWLACLRCHGSKIQLATSGAIGHPAA